MTPPSDAAPGARSKRPIAFMKHSTANPEEIDLDLSPSVITPPALAVAESLRHDALVSALRVVWDRRKFLARVAGVAAVAAALGSFLIPNRYTATARLMPPDQMYSGTAMLAAAAGAQAGAGSNLGSIAGDLLGLKNSGALFVGILQSRTICDDLVSKFSLQKVYWDRRREDARNDLMGYTHVAEDRKSGIITIEVTDRSAPRAAALAAEYIDELDRVVARLNTSSAHRERVFLEQRLQEVSRDLENAENGFSQFASKNTAIDIPAQGKAMIEAAATLEGHLIAAETELQSLKQVYADENVRVRAVQAEVNEFRRQLAKLGGTPNSPAAGDAENAASLYPSIRQLPLLGVNYADLYRKMKVQESVFETLTREFELAKVEEAKETPSVKVIDPPEIPEKKSSPHRVLLILTATLVSIGCACALVIGRERWNVVDREDPGKQLALEIFHTLALRWPKASTNGHHLSAAVASTHEVLPEGQKELEASTIPERR
jgi:capsule polysaccharide export protein KpsE/RkpR